MTICRGMTSIVSVAVLGCAVALSVTAFGGCGSGNQSAPSSVSSMATAATTGSDTEVIGSSNGVAGRTFSEANHSTDAGGQDATDWTNVPDVGVSSEAKVAEVSSEPPPFPVGTKVLIVGSSTANAIGVQLKKQLQQNNVKCRLAGKDSTYISQWAGPDMNLQQLISYDKPDLVIVSLGGNETAVPDPNTRIKNIKRIVQIIGNRPCVWLGTPRWEAITHTGLLEVIEQNIAPCKFVDSDILSPNMKTMPDRVHPTMPERKRWARRMLLWLQYNRNPNGARPWDFNDHLVMPPEDKPQPQATETPVQALQAPNL